VTESADHAIALDRRRDRLTNAKRRSSKADCGGQLGRRPARRTRAEIGLPKTVDGSFMLTDGDTVESVLAQYRQAWANADEIASAYSLDDLAMHNRRGPLSLRWIYVHMIEELAWHAGHGILREQILAAGGSQA
jgi:hypothetical protein